MEINILVIVLLAFIGGMATALLGWAEQATPWSSKKFTSSIIRSLIGAAGIAAVTDYSGATAPIIYLLVFLSGAGVEVGGNRVAGAIATRRR